MHKNTGLEVTDRIEISIEKNEKIEPAIQRYGNYICSETLANAIQQVEHLDGDVLEDELTDQVSVRMKIQKNG